MLADLEELVVCESFSADHAALARSAEVVGALGARLLGAEPERIVIEGVTHLRWVFGTPRVLLVGHHDTVWPMGSLRSHPWSVVDGVARGPGVLDMKAGLVQMFHAVASLPSLEGVCVLVNGDEEVGSPTSRGLIEQSARGCAAAFVLEAAANEQGALKTARKGTARYEVVVHGKAAHAGLEPHKGVNAAIEAAHQVLAITELAASVNTDATSDAGSAPGAATITPTLLSAGSTLNTVPALARISVDVRVPSPAAQDRTDALMRGLTARTDGARLEVLGGRRRPPMEPESSAELFALAAGIAEELGQEPLRGIAVGGASDGNYTAGVGCPTLDGLGGVGSGAHADSEHVVVARIIPRTRLLARLIERTQR
ncbi:M20/M25/M40 family metallo-hydrolase [Streptomyces sp. RKAG337]|uniref:M20/M25/M40 family metallo-hydrolase n=1 Tax=Streptomyces sp. RKAG337 TaxID=2893404 RepID=UPI0020343A66|nr:M20/M25/M40 family metallo-hydrolase [Streptomyces sp. RKAG337]MCM2430635.1 M20/M25/M40 family metallo-hydrolase [Streptomyces sp. RKAG337]